MSLFAVVQEPLHDQGRGLPAAGRARTEAWLVWMGIHVVLSGGHTDGLSVRPGPMVCIGAVLWMDVAGDKWSGPWGEPGGGGCRS
jgi:hypothetical protein